MPDKEDVVPVSDNDIQATWKAMLAIKNRMQTRSTSHCEDLDP